MRTWSVFGLAALGLAVGCSSSDSSGGSAGGSTPDKGGESTGENPFTQSETAGPKADTAYMNPDGREVEVDLEADVEAPDFRKDYAPSSVAQYAMTYLRQRGEFYLESLAEDFSASVSRVEWLVDGTWMTAAQAVTVEPSLLRHFRLRGVNAVLLNSAAEGVKEGSEFTAKVPVRPYDVWTEAGDKCADRDSHMTLEEGVYWYLWNPERTGCNIQTQDMKITVSKMFPDVKTVYPEYDQLVADGKVTAVVLFGKIGDELSSSDPGMLGLRQMSRWLKAGGFKEVTPAPLGTRFTKHIGSVDFEIDLYSPYEFAGLSDSAHFSNFQKAISEHEIVTYDGHSMLGASDFWSRPQYPDSYQIYLYGGCLGYEYYIRPILDGKSGNWDKLDILSSVVEVTASANDFAAPILAKIAYALDHQYKVSWRDLLVASRERVGDSTFGVSGVRDNCFSPGGSLCGEEPVGESGRYENTTAAEIPDNQPDGVSTEIDVPDSFTMKSLTLELDVTHTWVGDLKISLSHNDKELVVWDNAGNSQRNIKQSFTLADFVGQDVNGKWTLHAVDSASRDTGSITSWVLVAGK